MSIKSEKSLLEECSEIIEKSYSVRSASEESLSGFVFKRFLSITCCLIDKTILCMAIGYNSN